MARHIATALALAFLGAGVLHAEPLRVATYNVELGRKGPGLLLADILKGEAQVEAVVSVIAQTHPDVLLLTDFDYDLDGHALAAFVALLEEAGMEYPFTFAPPPNSGLATGVDLDGDGTTHEARDSQGYGAFTGSGGLALLSKYPIGETRDFNEMLWSELPGHIAPEVDGKPFPSEAARAIQRLSSVAHFDAKISAPGGPIHILGFNATTPVFDGPEDLNGRRNHDEIMFWKLLLDGALRFDPPSSPMVVMGDANLDPADGEGRRGAIDSLLTDPRLQDPKPTSSGARATANPEHRGAPELDTVDWSDPVPGNLRVDYVIPDATLTVMDAGVVWPAPGTEAEAVVTRASRHRMVWVDITVD